MTNESPKIEQEDQGPSLEDLAKFKTNLPRLAWLYEQKFGKLPPEFYKPEDKS